MSTWRTHLPQAGETSVSASLKDTLLKSSSRSAFTLHFVFSLDCYQSARGLKPPKNSLDLQGKQPGPGKEDDPHLHLSNQPYLSQLTVHLSFYNSFSPFLHHPAPSALNVQSLLHCLCSSHSIGY